MLASATNIFCVGGLPNFICILLYYACQSWFTNQRDGTTNIQSISDYSTAQVKNYLWVLLVIMLLGVVVNLLPPVRDYVQSIEEKAADIVRTPGLQKKFPTSPKLGGRTSSGVVDEESPLIAASPGTLRYHKYLQYGRGPVLYKMGSMRAGQSLSQSDLPGTKLKGIKYKYVPKLYQSEPRKNEVARGPDGKPVTAGALQNNKNPKALGRSSSTG